MSMFNAKEKLSCSMRLFAIAGLMIVGGSACDPGETEGGEDVSQDLSFNNIPGQQTPFAYDSGTTCTVQNVTAHCCPSGMVMTGANLGGNRFKCALIAGTLGSKHIADFGSRTPIQRNGMHACPFGEVMVGYFHGSGSQLEYLICALPSPAPVAHEIVDGNPPTSDGSMHVCPEKGVTNPGRYAMTGINASTNMFTCGRGDPLPGSRVPTPVF